MESVLRMQYYIEASCDPSFLLGIEVQNDKAAGDIPLSQEANAQSILESYRMARCRSVC